MKLTQINLTRSYILQSLAYRAIRKFGGGRYNAYEPLSTEQWEDIEADAHRWCLEFQPLTQEAVDFQYHEYPQPADGPGSKILFSVGGNCSDN